MTPGKLADAAAGLLHLDTRDRYRPALGIKFWSDQPAGTAPGHPESILQNTHGSRASRRAQKPPEAGIFLLQLLEWLNLSTFHPAL